MGAALAVSGAAYQGMFRNPMVSPDILGASTGDTMEMCIRDRACAAAHAFLFGFICVYSALCQLRFFQGNSWPHTEQ